MRAVAGPMTTQGAKSVDEVAPYSAVLPASNCLPSPPRFTFGPFPSSVAASYYRATHLHGMGVYAGDNLTWSDGFVIDPDGNFIVGGQVHIHDHVVGELGADRKAAIRSASSERLQGTAARIVLPGSAHKIYGHWLVDMLPKLAVLEAAGHDWKSLWYPVPDDTPQFGIDLMMLFGIPQNRIVRLAGGRGIRADTLLMPTSLHNSVRFSPLLLNAVALFRRGISHSTALAGPARIFLARKGRNRLLTNRARIEEMAASAGFEIVFPETKTLSEQVALFSSAREIVGEYGSAFHTAMFSPPGTVICGLRGGQVHPAFIQSGIGDVLDQPTGYVFGQPEGDPARYDYAVSEDAFSDCLKTVFDRHAGLAVRVTPVQPRPAPVAAAEPASRGAVQRPAWRRFAGWFSPGGKAAATPSAAQKTPATPAVFLMGHVQNRGDTEAGPDGWLGSPGSSLAIEGFRLSLGAGLSSCELAYQALLADDQLSEPVKAGLYCGTRGKGLPLFGLVLRVDAASAASFGIQAEGQFRDGTVDGPVGPGTILRSATPSPLTALRITVKPN